MIAETWKAGKEHYGILDKFVKDVSMKKCEDFKMRGDVDDGLARISYKNDEMSVSEDDEVLVSVYLEGGRRVKGISLVTPSREHYNECVNALEKQLGLDIRNKIGDSIAAVSS